MDAVVQPRSGGRRTSRHVPDLPLDILNEARRLPLDTLNEVPVAQTDLDFLRGSLDVILLRTLAGGPAHGLAIARWIRAITDDALQLDEGSLYPALYRMENRGWIRATWRVTENNRRAKYYALTMAGRRQLAEQTETWHAFVDAVVKVFAATTPASPATAK